MMILMMMILMMIQSGFLDLRLRSERTLFRPPGSTLNETFFCLDNGVHFILRIIKAR
jgi:hypothetical protein